MSYSARRQSVCLLTVVAALACSQCCALAERASQISDDAGYTTCLAEGDNSLVLHLDFNMVASDAKATISIAPNSSKERQLVPADVIVGVASYYDYPGNTASGEPYDPNAFTAAVHFSVRHEFGGIRYGNKYQAAYGIAEHGGKKLILKLNDVGPLRPGRKFDLSRAAMTYFGGLTKGLLTDFKVTRLPIGVTYRMGPITEEETPAVAGQQFADLPAEE